MKKWKEYMMLAVLCISMVGCGKKDSGSELLTEVQETVTPVEEVVKPEGTFYIFPKAPEADVAAFCQKALQYDLVLVPADSFGCPGYFRMAYCIDTEKVERSLPVLRKMMKEIYG